MGCADLQIHITHTGYHNTNIVCRCTKRAAYNNMIYLLYAEVATLMLNTHVDPLVL